MFSWIHIVRPSRDWPNRKLKNITVPQFAGEKAPLKYQINIAGYLIKITKNWISIFIGSK